MLLQIKSKFINIFKHLNVLNILIYKCNILSKSCISKAIQVLWINCKKTKLYENTHVELMYTLLYRDRGLNGYFIVKKKKKRYIDFSVFSDYSTFILKKKNEVLISMPSVNLAAIHRVNEKSWWRWILTSSDLCLVLWDNYLTFSFSYLKDI